ncbi:phosphodiesterase, MJ0936 family [Desulfofundulus kuznetsovii DSM 6115]|uniref:Phosphoesterase n=1 Tax=Desulfofundulus kuznetsovii (strain DSM 6115 / VKM B-1805 / 17) TaxID=760568 RepID=A0AAU8PAP6_DESK7|nr:phosphodiesterase, MJ0936 family [Desulfofundulus kuznetsovii DSM 6115]
MRVGVVSDTHGRVDRAIKLLNQLKPLDLLLHAGDYYRDGRLLAEALKVPVHAVAGNCDFETGGPEEEVLALEGKKVFLTHGHLYHVHFSLQKLLYRALELQADVVVFGHTHVRYCQEHEGILFFNPGSVYAPRGEHGPGCGLLVMEGREVKPGFGP